MHSWNWSAIWAVLTVILAGTGISFGQEDPELGFRLLGGAGLTAVFWLLCNQDRFSR